MPLTKPDNKLRLSGVPAAAFIHLAGAVQKCSTIWANARVLFLLDDVSTRFLKEQRIRDLLSALLFSDPLCSFKVTTEAQTFLQSPAIIEVARPGRDYDTFDLGADVYQRLRDNGKSFLEQILYHRAQFYSHHPQSRPAQIVGDVPLETIARTIAAAPKTSGTRKEVYHGMSALAALCVGDIGDVINLYERMLARFSGAAEAVAPRIQSEAYQDFCNRHLYHLNRRGNEFKDFALTFAAASHELLLKSAREIADGTETRLRQYMKLYVRVTTGDLHWQLDKLRELIDSGVFILAGGSDTPRMKTKDADPVHQFVLTYRKLLGLSNFIGLAERDRFELSGGQLEEWLTNPARGEEILMRNLGGPEPQSEQPPPDEPSPQPGQIDLFTDGAPAAVPKTRRRRSPRLGSSRGKAPAFAVPTVREVPLQELPSFDVSHALLGLGFEERTAKSATRWLKHAKPLVTTLLDYSESSPRRAAILAAAANHSRTVEVMRYADFSNYRTAGGLGCPLVDVTGLAKPALFYGIRHALLTHRRVLVIHTRAERYYPCDSDIAEVLRAHRKRDPSLLDELQRILTGESGPYKVMSLLESDADASRRRILFAFASAKHQRLLTLLENRDYDAVEIVAPASASPRSKIAALAADVAIGMVQEGHVVKIESSDLPRNLSFLAERYSDFYMRQGFNVEFGLTGSKLQGVAAAALTTAAKIAHSWYIGPSEFDPKRFTEGVGETRCFLIETPAPAI